MLDGIQISRFSRCLIISPGKYLPFFFHPCFSFSYWIVFLFCINIFLLHFTTPFLLYLHLPPLPLLLLPSPFSSPIPLPLSLSSPHYLSLLSLSLPLSSFTLPSLLPLSFPLPFRSHTYKGNTTGGFESLCEYDKCSQDTDTFFVTGANLQVEGHLSFSVRNIFFFVGDFMSI